MSRQSSIMCPKMSRSTARSIPWQMRLFSLLGEQPDMGLPLHHSYPGLLRPLYRCPVPWPLVLLINPRKKEGLSRRKIMPSNREPRVIPYNESTEPHTLRATTETAFPTADEATSPPTATCRFSASIAASGSCVTCKSFPSRRTAVPTGVCQRATDDAPTLSCLLA
jgi:hypothetical protein